MGFVTVQMFKNDVLKTR